MEDKSLFTSGQPQTISEGLQNFIDSMVEEIVLEGRPFDTQKKYLKKFSENEGMNYEKLEADITTFIEIVLYYKTSPGELMMKLAKEKARDCHISEAIVEGLLKSGVRTTYSASNHPMQQSKNVVYGHEYVDLGLPSGTLWAICNVGATTPEGYGDYFAWGETQPKSDYSSQTYRYYKQSMLSGYPSTTAIKYTEESNLKILQPDDDAATANWGKDWHMPTQEQWEELIKYTTNIWTTRNGVSGWLFTASNGNSVFLPTAGHIFGSEYTGVENSGSYWSSSLLSTIENYGSFTHHYISGPACFDFGLDFNGTPQAHLNHGSRHIGMSIRPVRSSR